MTNHDDVRQPDMSRAHACQCQYSERQDQKIDAGYLRTVLILALATYDIVIGLYRISLYIIQI